jgi:SAM-dependent methyltransferase
MVGRHDAYRGIARHYDLHKMDWYAATYGKRLRKILTDRGLAGCSVLDAGCGTGTLALAMAGHGHRVTGLDLSEALLGEARAKDASRAVRWVHGDVTESDLGETFDAITCVADVLNHLETLDDWERAFRCFARHLRPGGYLIFDVLTCLGLERQDTYSTQDRNGGVLILGVIWEPASRRSTLKITSFVPADRPGLYERASETISEWGHPVAAIDDRLTRAGFGQPERPWADSEDPEAEERLAVLAPRT